MKSKSILRKLALLLVVVFALMLPLSACDGGKKPANVVADGMKENLNFNGQEIAIVYPPGYGYLDEDGVNPYYRRRNERIKELSTKYNANIVQKEGKGMYWQMMVTSIAAGEPDGHIMLTTVNKFLDWYKADVFADFSEAMKTTGIDFTDPRYDQEIRIKTSLDDKVLGFAAENVYNRGSVWFYNKRIFKELGIENMQEILDSKQWTWAKVEEIATKATVLNQDGSVKRWGLMAELHNTLWGSLISTNGGQLCPIVDNKPKVSLSSPAVVRATETFYDWVVTKRIATVGNGIQAWDTLPREFVKGNSAILVAQNKFLNIAEETGMQDDFGVILPPIGPDTKDYTLGNGLGDIYFVPRTYQDMTTNLLLLIDELYAPHEGVTTEDQTVEAVGRFMRDEDSLDNYIKCVTAGNEVTITNPDFSAFMGYGWSTPSITEMLNDMMLGRKTPGEAINTYGTLFQTTAEDSWGDIRFTGLK